ncbi:MAG: energy-coupled thiamine transporter ThiT [Clostridium sp.]|jgi:thiamine transporter|nr:energy-coupled thiamine transporter ThiT [Clostridium sp.]
MIPSKTKQLVFSAAAIALAIVIANALKLPSLPFGGSVTLCSMLIVSLVGYFFGPVTGLTAAVAYGILQFITGPYVVHPIQVLLDYPLAFGALGLSGFFCRRKHGLILGYLASVSGRFLFASLSGLLFYTTYTGSLGGNVAAIWGSLAYNLSYLLPEAVLTLILLCIPPVSRTLARLKAMACGS